MIKIPYNQKLIDRNEKAYGMNDGTHCIICNKPVNMKKNRLWVRIVNGGTHIGTSEEAENAPAADLGYYPIGADCLKRNSALVEYVHVHATEVSA